MKRVLFAALLILFPFSASADCSTYWEIATVAEKSQSSATELRADGRGVITIPTRWFRQVYEIKKKIDTASGIYTKLFVCDSATTNAFASRTSGQNVVMITLGMYKLIGNDWDAYAALLGHENTHLVRGHGLQRQVRQVGIGILELLAGAALEAMTKHGTLARGIGSEVVKIGSQAVYASYSRDDEREADRDGVLYAYRSGYDPSGAIRLHQKLASAGDFLSSHPSSTDRISSLRAEIALITNSGQSVRTVRNTNQEPRTERRSVARATPPAASETVASLRTQAPRRKIAYGTGGNGVVLKVKARYSYYIASQSNFTPPVKGAIAFINIGSRKIRGTVERVIGGYFSVLADTSIDDSLIGKRVEFQ